MMGYDELDMRENKREKFLVFYEETEMFAQLQR
jgi:hypothetical protein